MTLPTDNPYEVAPGIYAVADAIGGDAGRRAAEIALDALRAGLARGDDLVRAFERANVAVRTAIAAAPVLRGAGSAIAVLCLDGVHAPCVTWVGDLRVYRLRDDELTLLTRDHTLLDDYIRKGLMRADDPHLEDFPHKNVIVRAIGMKDDVDVDSVPVATTPGDLFAIVSNGIAGALGETLLSSTLRGHRANLQACTRALLEEANANGAKDDLHVALVRVA